MMAEIASIPSDGKTQVKTSQIEYRITSSRGATAMVFLDPEKALAWAQNQRDKFGDRAPSMKITKRVTVQIEEEVCDV